MRVEGKALARRAYSLEGRKAVLIASNKVSGQVTLDLFTGGM